MIKQTFYNLSADKRRKLIDIAKKEFSLKPIHEATIANIVNRFGIARSSFYNYFDSIDDLYFYVLSEFRNIIEKESISSLQKNKGDLFKAAISVYDYIVSETNKDIDIGIIKNVFINSSSNIQNFMISRPTEKEKKDKLKEWSNLIDQSNFKENNNINILIELLIDIFIQNLIHYFMDNMSKKEARGKFVKKINIIKCGICEEKK